MKNKDMLTRLNFKNLQDMNLLLKEMNLDLQKRVESLEEKLGKSK